MGEYEKGLEYYQKAKDLGCEDLENVIKLLVKVVDKEN